MFKFYERDVALESNRKETFQQEFFLRKNHLETRPFRFAEQVPSRAFSMYSSGKETKNSTLGFQIDFPKVDCDYPYYPATASLQLVAVTLSRKG